MPSVGKNLNYLQLLYTVAEISTIVVLLVYYSHAYARINELVKVRISQPQTMHYPSIKEKVLLPSQMASQQHSKSFCISYLYYCNSKQTHIGQHRVFKKLNIHKAKPYFYNIIFVHCINLNASSRLFQKK